MPRPLSTRVCEEGGVPWVNLENEGIQIQSEGPLAWRETELGTGTCQPTANCGTFSIRNKETPAASLFSLLGLPLAGLLLLVGEAIILWWTLILLLRNPTYTGTCTCTQTHKYAYTVTH